VDGRIRIREPQKIRIRIHNTALLKKISFPIQASIKTPLQLTNYVSVLSLIVFLLCVKNNEQLDDGGTKKSKTWRSKI
jgi:hypothetical protein